MKSELQELLARAVTAALPEADPSRAPHVERTRDAAHGDFASNVAMVYAKQAGQPPRQLAQMIIDSLPASDLVEKAEIAGPGFINFFLRQGEMQAVVRQVLEAGADWGRGSQGAGLRVMVEFVSANPTGPLHVGHGRGAAYGDCVSRLLAFTGFDVTREYYINDAGRQMDILALSLWLRYLQACGEQLDFPGNAYQGDYVIEAAATLRAQRGDDLRIASDDVLAAQADAESPDVALDAMIARARDALGADEFLALLDIILTLQIDDIRDDLEQFRVGFDHWFSERGLVTEGAVQHALKGLSEAGHVYEQDGATWFASSRFGDEKDRVLVRASGSHTYFAADIAYHLNKLDRGFERLVDIWGADHHGYVPRVRAAVAALTGADDRLAVQLVQFANLYRGAERLPMSTRAGQYVTLRELRDEVGTDAARYFYVMRSNDQHLDFDLELAKSRSNENPVYYIQYAHARVCSVAEQARDKQWPADPDSADLTRLDTEQEQRLITLISKFPEIVENAALNYAPQTLAHYLRDLADAFHSLYNAHQFIVDDAALRNARLALALAARQTLANGLDLLGVDAPQSM